MLESLFFLLTEGQNLVVNIICEFGVYTMLFVFPLLLVFSSRSLGGVEAIRGVQFVAYLLVNLFYLVNFTLELQARQFLGV